MCNPWVGLDLEEKLLNYKSFCILDLYNFFEGQMLCLLLWVRQLSFVSPISLKKMIPDYRTAVSRSQICLLQCVFQKGTTEPLENQKFCVYSLGWAGFGEKMLNLKAFAFWIYTKEVDAQRD